MRHMYMILNMQYKFQTKGHALLSCTYKKNIRRNKCLQYMNMKIVKFILFSCFTFHCEKLFVDRWTFSIRFDLLTFDFHDFIKEMNLLTYRRSLMYLHIMLLKYDFADDSSLYIVVTLSQLSIFFIILFMRLFEIQIFLWCLFHFITMANFDVCWRWIAVLSVNDYLYESLYLLQHLFVLWVMFKSSNCI